MRNQWTVFLLMMSLFGCASSPPPAAIPTPASSVRMVVFPIHWVTPEPSSNVLLNQAILEGVGSQRGLDVELIPVDESREPPCQEDLDCVRDAGETHQSSKAIVTKIASLGDTILIRMTVVDVQAGTQEQTRQAIAKRADTSLETTVRKLAGELAKPYGLPPPVQEPSLSWYERWWVWAAVGGVAATSVAVPLLLQDRGSEAIPPDVIITPP